MPQLSDWKPPNSEGILPLEGNASQMQYRYAVQWEFPIDYLLAGMLSAAIGAMGGIPVIGQSIGSKDLWGEWKIRLWNDDTIIFEQHVKITLNVTFMAFSVFGVLNMGFFVWAFKKEEIISTIVDGEAITESNPAWGYTLGNTQYGEQGYMERGGGGDYTDNAGIINDWWDSPVYLMNVPVGTRLEIVFARATGGTIPHNLLFQFRFNDAGRIGVFKDLHGATRLGLPIRNRVFHARTYYGPSQQMRRDHVANADNPTLWKDGTNRLYLAVHSGARGNRQWLLWQSDNEGLSMAPVVYPDAWEGLNSEELEGQQVAIWTGNFRDVHVAARRSGGYVSVARYGGDLYFMASQDNIVPGEIRKVGEDDGKACYILVGQTADGKERLEIVDGYDLHYESRNGGIEWDAVA